MWCLLLSTSLGVRFEQASLHPRFLWSGSRHLPIKMFWQLVVFIGNSNVLQIFGMQCCFLLLTVLACFAAVSMESSAKESFSSPKQLCHTLGQPYSSIWIELVFRDRHHFCIQGSRWIHEILSTLHSVHRMFARQTIVSIQSGPNEQLQS